MYAEIKAEYSHCISLKTKEIKPNLIAQFLLLFYRNYICKTILNIDCAWEPFVRIEQCTYISTNETGINILLCTSFIIQLKSLEEKTQID